MYCACHAKESRGPAGDNPRRNSFRRLCVLRLPGREKPRPGRRQSAPQLLFRRLCVLRLPRRSRGPAGDNPRHNSFRRLCVLRLPGKEKPRPSRRQSAPQLLREALCTAPATQRRAAAQPATIRAAAPSEGSVYCACHAERRRGPAGDNPRPSSFRRLCVLRLPHKEKPRFSRRQSAPQLLQKALCTAPARQREAAAQPATICAAAPSGGSVYCACQAERSRGPAGDNPRRGRLCVLRLPRKGEPRPSRRQSAPQLLQKALCTAPATQRESAAQPATIRAPAPSGGSVYCACHAKRSRGPAGDNPRHNSFRRLCVLRLPGREKPRPSRRQSAPQLLQEALCPAPSSHVLCVR